MTVDQLITKQFTAAKVDNWQDRAGNIIAKIPGQNSESAIAITAHKDEIGMIFRD